MARYASVWVAKRQVVAILLSNRSEMGPTGVARGGYTTTVPHWVHIMLGGYELKGMIETAGKFNFGAVMFEASSTFIPIYQAKLTAILFPNVQTEAPAMLFNRDMVDGMALLPKEEIPADASVPSQPAPAP